MWDLLTSQALAVHQQFHFVQIGIDPQRNFISLPAVPIPVREQMQRWFVAPPRFVIEEVVFRETTHVDDSELRVDGRPAIGSRFSAIVEASPREPASFPFLRSIELPPCFRRLAPW